MQVQTSDTRRVQSRFHLCREFMRVSLKLVRRDFRFRSLQDRKFSQRQRETERERERERQRENVEYVFEKNERSEFRLQRENACAVFEMFPYLNTRCLHF